MMALFSNIKNAWHLFKQVDMEQLSHLSKRIDLAEVMNKLGKLDDRKLSGLMKLMDGNQVKKELPPIDGDFYNISHTLTPDERALQLRVRAFMEEEVKPIANDYWLKGEFPHHLIPKVAELDICGMTYAGFSDPVRSCLIEGVLAIEMARIDASFATFFGVQSGLVMGSVHLLGSEEQKREWLPALKSMRKIGAFGLTEPEVGSAVAGGLTMKAKRNGNTWTLNGKKKWIGNATFADVIIIWAEDEDDRQIKGFLVRKENPGLQVAKMEDKMALRIVQNGLVTLTACVVEEADRLQKANSFKDTADVLRITRAGVAWLAVGCARGAYEAALKYTRERMQFGKPIASFQLIQNHLVEMLTNLTAMQTMVARLSELQDQKELTDEHASLAKVFCSLRTRDIVSKAREVMGGNGILLEYDVARFVADAEAIYSYEGTKEINTLIVGRAITGYSAFV
ncbi:acyl-CoA dehydrogenase [Fluviicola chungangensis]|uniref:Acyl-CoA dehydrogenase n=2 Tax=Fluviicola chungangensis TaxID=2597671 RepID=A0A556MQ91_9FLAO|nr:acyl-CoA dehydrogenase [Fluviicola chungangensis]